MEARSVSNVKVALVWAVLGAVATAAVFPYVIALLPEAFAKVPMPIPVVIALQLVQATALVFLLSWVGLICGNSLSLDSPLMRAWLSDGAVTIKRRRLLIVILVGSIIALALLAMDSVFQRYMPASFSALPKIAFWKRIAAAPYGGIVEECLCRLFLVSVIAWMIARVFARRRTQVPPWVFWIAIVAASLLFGIGHLPAAAQLWPLTTTVILRTILLNSIAGVSFGWFFWRWGLEYAVIAHFSCDVVLHGLGSA